jgi:hypothetical protein
MQELGRYQMVLHPDTPDGKLSCSDESMPARIEASLDSARILHTKARLVINSANKLSMANRDNGNPTFPDTDDDNHK